MSQSSGYFNKPFTIWLIANILGFGALGIAVLVIPSVMAVPGMLGSTLVISIPISLAQWIALRRISFVSMLWILSIPIGVLMAILIIREIPDGTMPIVDDESPSAMTVIFLFIGFLIGLPQWLILRRYFSNSSIWLLGSSLGVALGAGLVLITDLINQSTILSYIVAALVYAVLTGLTLSWLLARQDQSQSNMVSTA